MYRLGFRKITSPAAPKCAAVCNSIASSAASQAVADDPLVSYVACAQPRTQKAGRRIAQKMYPTRHRQTPSGNDRGGKNKGEGKHAGGHQGKESSKELDNGNIS